MRTSSTFPERPEPRAPDHELRGLGARYRIYDATDGWVFLAAPCEHEWEPLVAALAPYVDLAGDGRFTNESDRCRNDAELADVLAVVFASRGKDDWERELVRGDVGCVAVTTEQHRNHVVEQLVLGRRRLPGRRRAPDLRDPSPTRSAGSLLSFEYRAEPGVLAGSATDTVLRELGHSDESIADLRERSIIR